MKSSSEILISFVFGVMTLILGSVVLMAIEPQDTIPRVVYFSGAAFIETGCELNASTPKFLTRSSIRAIPNFKATSCQS